MLNKIYIWLVVSLWKSHLLLTDAVQLTGKFTKRSDRCGSSAQTQRISLTGNECPLWLPKHPNKPLMPFPRDWCVCLCPWLCVFVCLSWCGCIHVCVSTGYSKQQGKVISKVGVKDFWKILLPWGQWCVAPHSFFSRKVNCWERFSTVKEGSPEWVASPVNVFYSPHEVNKVAVNFLNGIGWLNSCISKISPKDCSNVKNPLKD